MTTPLFLLRCVQLGLSMGDLDFLTIGLVNDMFTERENDECHYDVLADQRDFDRICAEWTSYQREKSGLCDLVRIVADVSAGERDILVIYCMGAPAA